MISLVEDGNFENITKEIEIMKINIFLLNGTQQIVSDNFITKTDGHKINYSSSNKLRYRYAIAIIVDIEVDK